MAKKPETLFKEQILPKLRNIPNSWFEKIQQRSLRGTPDIIGCINGRFVAIELKQSKSARVDYLQNFKLNKIDKAGGIAIILYPENWENVFNILIGLRRKNVI